MCYNFKTSILSYTLGMIAGILSILYKKIELGILILFYSQMQLSEALIWRGIDTDNINLNKTGTLFGKYLLATHNIALGIGIIVAALYNKTPLNLYLLLPLIIGIIFFGVISYLYKKTQSVETTYPLDSSCSKRECQNPGNRLRWPYPHDWYFCSFIISLVILCIYIKPLKSRVFLGTAFSLLFIISYIANPKTVGSVWCFSTAIFAPVIALINILI